MKLVIIVTLCLMSVAHSAEISAAPKREPTEESRLTKQIYAYMEPYYPFESFDWMLEKVNGKFEITLWTSKTIPKPDLSPGKIPSYELAKTNRDHITIETDPDTGVKVWKKKPPAEVAEIEYVKNVTKQASKPKPRRRAENKFIALRAELAPFAGTNSLATVADIMTVIETVAETNEKKANNFLLRLIALDATLKTYSETWYEDVYEHKGDN